MSDELDGMWERYVALRVEHTCKEISEGVYEHTFTPVPTRELADAGVFLLTRSSAKSQRYVRARKRERRQHRAAFRRRKRGLA